MQEMRNRHVRRERIKTIPFTNLFGRYEILSVLGSGASATVYLARHLKLKTLCAIKCIPRTYALSSSHLAEARLLKILKHPGIPILFDYEEDEQNFYLVEEYIQGDSLEVFTLHSSIISESFIIQTGIQLCEILSYLHQLYPEPVLYQDLKPEHIFVCGNQIKLIDFGTAAFLSEAGNNPQFFGTAAFSAPEVKHGQHCSIQSDLYSLGKVLAFLTDTAAASCSAELLYIIDTCCAEDEAKRFSSAQQVLDSLLCLRKETCLPHLSNQFAVVSSDAGIGATHFAISLVSVLNKNGYLSYYEEKNSSQSLQKLFQPYSSFSQQDGILSYKYLKALPHYGEGIALPAPTDGIRVRDYGVYRMSEIELDYEENILFLMGCREWELEHTYAVGEQIRYRKHISYICNYGNQQMAQKFASHFGQKVYSFPLDADPFDVTAEKEALCLKLLGLKKGGVFSSYFGRRGNRKNVL